MNPFGGGMLGAQRQVLKCQTCFYLLSFGYKFFFVVCGITAIISVTTQYAFYNCVNPSLYDLNIYHPWNIITSWTVYGDTLTSLLGFLVDFFWLFYVWQGLEQKFSTSYMFFQVFIQNFTINLFFAPIGYLLYSIGLSPQYLFNYRLTGLILIFMWKNVSYNPDEYIKYCFVPCLVKNRFVPLISMAILLLFRYDQIISVLIAGLLGYIQSFIFKKDIVTLPLAIYRKFDYCFPRFISQRKDFTSVKKVEADLRTQCCLCCYTQPNQDDPNRPSIVEVIGGGTQIGGGAAVNAQGVWANKNSEDRETGYETPAIRGNQNEFESDDNIDKKDKYRNTFNDHLCIDDGEEEEENKKQKRGFLGQHKK